MYMYFERPNSNKSLILRLSLLPCHYLYIKIPLYKNVHVSLNQIFIPHTCIVHVQEQWAKKINVLHTDDGLSTVSATPHSYTTIISA
jgi:hypothetical protein